LDRANNHLNKNKQAAPPPPPGPTPTEQLLTEIRDELKAR
jgi:large conductance mechanosensitive channel